jgi:hypothetical protein
MCMLILCALCLIGVCCWVFGKWGILVGIGLLWATLAYTSKHPNEKHTNHDMFDSFINGEDIQSTHCGEIWNDKFKL